MSRLLAAGDESYTYDNAGNRTTKVKGQEKFSYKYDARNRLTEATSSIKGTTVYTYDNNGNQLTSSDGTVYTYDGFNRLIGDLEKIGQRLYDSGSKGTVLLLRGNIYDIM